MWTQVLDLWEDIGEVDGLLPKPTRGIDRLSSSELFEAVLDPILAEKGELKNHMETLLLGSIMGMSRIFENGSCHGHSQQTAR